MRGDELVSRQQWARLAQMVPPGWYRDVRSPDPIDHQLDVALNAVMRADVGELGVFDLQAGQDVEARMLQTYAVRSAGRAVVGNDPERLRRAAVAVVISSPISDWRDQLRVIAVLADACARLGGSLRSINEWLSSHWPPNRVGSLVEFDRRYRGRDRAIETMSFRTEGSGRDFRYVDRLEADSDPNELADLLEEDGESPDLVAALRAEARRQTPPAE